MSKLLPLCIAIIAACKPTTDDASQAQARDTYVWFKEPAVIRNTIVKTWGIRITPEDDLMYFSKMGQLYGALDPNTGKANLREPNETYALALDMVSLWISNLLLDKQVADEMQPDAQDAKMLFHGQIGFSLNDLPDKKDCFEDSKRDWCDADDEITTQRYSAADKERLLDPKLSSSERKRLMHNIQDIGDFLGATIDNLLLTDGKHAHVPQYLLDEIFIPNLDPQQNSDTVCCDVRAWQQVVYNILMSGQFFMYLPDRSF